MIGTKATTGAPALSIASAALLLLLAAGSSRFVDPDIWHGMALVRESLRVGHIPSDDRFAYTPTVLPVVHHEWAAAALVYAMSTGLGLTGLATLKWALTFGIAAGCYVVARRHGAGAPVILPLAFLAVFMVWVGITTVRAQMFSLLFLVALLRFVEEDRRGGKLWALPWLALYVVWLNCHAGFVVGAGLFAVHAAEQLARRRPIAHLALAGALMGVLVVANPWGVHYYEYLGRALLLDRSLVREWLPLWTAAPAMLPAFVASLLLGAYALRSRDAGPCAGWPLVAVTGVAALRHQRHLSLYAVTWLCTVPAWIEPTPFGDRLRAFWGRRAFATTTWAVVLVGALVAIGVRGSFALRVPANPGDHPTILYPAGAVSYLRREGFAGNLMVPFTIGAYVTWHLHPHVRVSFDGRYEVAYPPDALRENSDLYAARPGWRATLARYPTDAVLVPRTRPLARFLGTTPWSLVYDDGVYQVYARPGLRLEAHDGRGERVETTFP